MGQRGLQRSGCGQGWIVVWLYIFVQVSLVGLQRHSAWNGCWTYENEVKPQNKPNEYCNRNITENLLVTLLMGHKVLNWSHFCLLLGWSRVGQNRMHSLCTTLYLVISLPYYRIQVHHITLHMVLANLRELKVPSTLIGYLPLNRNIRGENL